MTPSTHRKSRRHPVRCPFTGKVRFRSPNDAKEALLKAALARRAVEVGDLDATRRREVRYHDCRCGGYHTTSQLIPRVEQPGAALVPGWTGAGSAIAGMALVAAALSRGAVA